MTIPNCFLSTRPKQLGILECDWKSSVFCNKTFQRQIHCSISCVYSRICIASSSGAVLFIQEIVQLDDCADKVT